MAATGFMPTMRTWQKLINGACRPALPQGRRAKDEAQRKQARAAIANARATRLELLGRLQIGTSWMDFVQAGPVDIAAVHDIKSLCFKFYDIQDVDIVDCAISNVDKAGNLALHI